MTPPAHVITALRAGVNDSDPVDLATPFGETSCTAVGRTPSLAGNSTLYWSYDAT